MNTTALPGGLWPAHARDARARWTYSRPVQLSGAAHLDTVRAHLSDLQRAAPHTVFVENLQGSGDSRATLIRRKREQRRPLTQASPALRALLQVFEDDTADLILVADRRTVAPSDLEAWLGQLLSGGAPAWPAPRTWTPSAQSLAPEWGVPNPDQPLQTLSARLTCDPGDLDPTLALTGALAQVAALYGTTVPVALLDQALPDPAPAEVGVLAPHLLGAGTTYLPGLAPLYPVTVAAAQTPDGQLQVEVLAETASVHPEVFTAWITALEATLRGPGAESVTTDQTDQVVPSAPGAPRGEDMTLMARFQRVVRDVPDHPALSDDTRTLTYRQLDERSNRVAAALRRSGMRVGDRVGLSLERTTDLVVAMLVVAFQIRGSKGADAIQAGAALTAAELFQSAGGWGLSYALAPDSGRRSEYLSSFNLGMSAQYVVGPVIVTVGVIQHGLTGWVALGLAVLLATLLIGSLVHRAAGRPLVHVPEGGAHV